ncbi:protein FAM219A-like [Uloborus diversus]|uniref:protein FAM219A-like n=1 Tax=Uloborus diversus TaxID=327109 RepID=UPI0024095D66|nr:protein FAM219A-like [Uloborus diversus]
MEDSGIDSDSKTTLIGAGKASATCTDTSDKTDHEENEEKAVENVGQNTNSECSSLLNDSSAVESHVVKIASNRDNVKVATKLMPSSVLQKRLEKQILQTRKLRQREQSIDGLPKKLIPRSRLRVPKSQTPIVNKTDSHPLVSWESDSDDDDVDYHPISNSTAKEITEQLIKDGYNLDLTPDDEDLDLIPPKPVTQRCVCCSVRCMCLIQ